MTQRFPSLEIVLELEQTERALLANHFAALDTKAGVVLGFAGVLVALGPGARSWLGIISVVGSVAAAFSAVAAFWPRSQPTLLPDVLDDYLRAEPIFTRIRVLDTLGLVIKEGREVLDRKGRKLKMAMVSLAIAALTYAVEQIVS